MDNYELIGMVIVVMSGALAFYAKLRSFEKSLMAEIENSMAEKLKVITKMIEQKADNKTMDVSIASIRESVAAIEKGMTAFMERLTPRLNELYDNDKAAMNAITEIRISQARHHD